MSISLAAVRQSTRVIVFAVLAQWVVLEASAQVAVPEEMRVQGVISSLGGSGVADGTYSFLIEIFPQAVGGTSSFSSTVSAEVASGAYSLPIVPATSGELEDAFIGPGARFVQITVLSGPSGAVNEVLLPRQPLATAPYAFIAGRALQAGVLPPSYLSGGALVYDAPSNMHVERVAARDSADEVDLRLDVALAKTINSSGAWEAGEDGAAIDGGAATDTWYAVLLIGDPSGQVDWGLDTDASASNLLIASGMTHFRRIGWVRTNGSGQLIQWLHDAKTSDYFYWANPQLSYDGNNEDFTGSNGVISLSHAPPQVVADFAWNIRMASGTDFPSFVTADQIQGVPSETSTPGYIARKTNERAAGRLVLATDGSRQIKFRVDSDSSLDLLVVVHGWRDERGKGE